MPAFTPITQRARLHYSGIRDTGSDGIRDRDPGPGVFRPAAAPILETCGPPNPPSRRRRSPSCSRTIAPFSPIWNAAWATVRWLKTSCRTLSRRCSTAPRRRLRTRVWCPGSIARCEMPPSTPSVAGARRTGRSSRLPASSTCTRLPEPEIEAEICACITRLAATLKPEYAEALDAIDVQGTPVKTFAVERGLTPGNAGVRVFRAREALKKRLVESCGTCAEHGCRDCTCQAC